MSDSYIYLLSISSAMRDRLAEPWTTFLGLVTLSIGLFTIAFKADRIPNLGRSGCIVDGQCRCYRLFWWGTFDIVNLLCSQSNLNNQHNTDGSSALRIAARSDFGRISSTLRQHGADPYPVDNHLATSLHTAISYTRDDIVDPLPKRHKNPNIIDTDGWTAFHIAARYEREDVSTILITKGVDISLRNPANETPLYISASRRRRPMRLLLDNGAQIIEHGKPLFIIL
ncbi:ankyrin [Amniculicola lignicola CBS 123094]|uniref:Ankyrin n=1 Tax=Amniculicola lignicola CBS 123094 TaxID=1392246 RepID=A0A6A5W5Q4_9PLEO|nr:ankyrin [Amniculicola lignicola CBS 123094]